MLARRRVVLVEFVNADQFPGRVSYNMPFLAGYYGSKGHEVRWIRFGISTTNLMEHGRDEITLSEAELQRLEDLVREHEATLLVVTDAIYEPQIKRVMAAAPGAKLHFAKDDRWLGKLLGRWRGLQEILQAGVVPRYDWEPGNEEATRKHIDNIYIVQAASCGHRWDVKDNPLYADLDDSRVAEHYGCAFCENWKGRKRYTRKHIFFKKPADYTTPQEWIDRQIEAIARSRGSSERFPNGVLLEQIPSINLLRGTIEALVKHGLADHVELLVAVRTDQIKRVERLLGQHFKEHAESKLRFGVYASGIESFDAYELGLLNKGTTPHDSIRAVNRLRAMRERFGERFWYTGLSFILFTPWTSLEALHLNVGLMRLLGLTRKVSGNMFQARLRLHDTLPITCLAEAQGLIAASEEDPAMSMNRRKLFEKEDPWSFKDPRVRPVSRIVLRFDLLDGELEDELAREVKKRIVQVAPGWTAGDDVALQELLLCVVEEAYGSVEVKEELALLDGAVARWKMWRERDDVSVPEERRYRIGENQVSLDGLLAKVVPVVKSGMIQTLAIDGVAEREISDEAKAWLPLQGLQYAVVDQAGMRLEPEKSPPRGTLILSKDGVALAQRMGVQSLLHQNDAKARREGVLRAATMHGMPECCARAQAGSGDRVREPWLYAWRALDSRAAEVGSVPRWLDPLLVPSISFVPCKPDCPEAADYLQARLKAIDPKAVLDVDDLHVFSLEEPGEGELVTIRECSFEEDEVRYEPESIREGKGEMRARLKAANRLVLVPGQIRLYRDEALVDVATATHGVWSPARCWHSAEWHELASAAAELGPSRERRERPALPPMDLPGQTPAAQETEPAGSRESAPSNGSPEAAAPVPGSVPAVIEQRASVPQTLDQAQQERQGRLQALVVALTERLGDKLGDLTVSGARQQGHGGDIELEARFSGGAVVHLRLGDPKATERFMLQTEHLCVTHVVGRGTDPGGDEAPSAAERERLARFIALLGAAMARHAPDLLPKAKPV
jgi:hypothetical protein